LLFVTLFAIIFWLVLYVATQNARLLICCYVLYDVWLAAKVIKPEV